MKEKNSLNNEQRKISMIYQNQVDAGEKLYDEFKSVYEKEEKDPTVLVIAQPQAGKTLSVSHGLERILNYLNEERKNKLRVFWLGPSDNALRAQTNEVLNGDVSYYDGCYLSEDKEFVRIQSSLILSKTYHAPSFCSDSREKSKVIDDFKNSEAKGYLRFLVIDEAHVGIGKGQTVPKLLDSVVNFLPGKSHEYKGTFAIVVSATPGAHLDFSRTKREETQKPAFRYVYLNPGEDYLSFEKIYSAGRLKETFQIKDGESEKKFIDEVLIPFLNEKSKGFLIVRNNNGSDPLTELLKRNEYSHKYDLVEYSSKKKNIDKLSLDISIQPEIPTICIITDSYLQGKTFDNVEYIRGWFDRSCDSSTQSFTVQSVGRNCGYKRKQYSYPIWANMNDVKAAINFYKKAEEGDWEWMEENILTTTHAKDDKASLKRENKWKLIPFDSEEGLDNYCEENNLVTGSRKSVKGNNKADLALSLLQRHPREFFRGSRTYKGGRKQTSVKYIVDGSNSNFKESWDDLVQQHPEFIGKFVLFEENTVTVPSKKERKINNSSYMID